VPTAPARVLAEPEAPALATAANADAANADAADAPDVLDLDSDASPAAPEMAALARDEAWLVVESRAHAFVYSSGILKGPTNEPLKIHCGTRFLRLGGPKLGDWLAPGSPVVIPCGKVTHLRIEPQH
jgi:hypothetical protein